MDAVGAERKVPAVLLDDARPLVAVCIATCRRPLLLRALLESVGAQEFTSAAPDVRIIVVDNDAQQTAAATVSLAAASLPWPVTYLVEPERNIALARNRGVAEALAGGADFIAFVDDDERVVPTWLATLLDVQRRWQADVVEGPVHTRLPEHTPAWVLRGGDADRRRLPTGRRLPTAATGNALVARQLLTGGAPFEAHFGLSGGSDTLFFSRCRRSGARIVWADEAVAEESASPRRASAGWFVRRAFRQGNAAMHCEQAMPAGLRQRGLQLLRACLRLGLAVACAAGTPFLGRAALLRSARHLAYAAGTFSAVPGYRYYEYAEPPEYPVGAVQGAAS